MAILVSGTLELGSAADASPRYWVGRFVFFFPKPWRLLAVDCFPCFIGSHVSVYLPIHITFDFYGINVGKHTIVIIWSGLERCSLLCWSSHDEIQIARNRLQLRDAIVLPMWTIGWYWGTYIRVPTPPMPRLPQEIAGLMIRDYENPLVSLNKAENWAGYFLGGSP